MSGFPRTSAATPRPRPFGTSRRSHGAWIATGSKGPTGCKSTQPGGNNATRTPPRRAERNPNQSRRNFRLIGTQSFNLANHIAVARRRSEDVETRDAWRQCRRAPGPLCATSGESADEDRGDLPICRDPGGRPRHRVLQAEWIESHVVDPASIANSRRCRRAKTDKIDGEALIRALLAYKRGEPRVCAMVKVPTPEEEDAVASAASARC
jgi:hypothetical protein